MIHQSQRRNQPLQSFENLCVSTINFRSVLFRPPVLHDCHLFVGIGAGAKGWKKLGGRGSDSGFEVSSKLQSRRPAEISVLTSEFKDLFAFGAFLQPRLCCLGINWRFWCCGRFAEANSGSMDRTEANSKLGRHAYTGLCFLITRQYPFKLIEFCVTPTS